MAQEFPVPPAPQAPKRSNSTYWIIGIVAVILLCCCALAAILWFSSDFILQLWNSM
jgi:hypothetical protein